MILRTLTLALLLALPIRAHAQTPGAGAPADAEDAPGSGDGSGEGPATAESASGDTTRLGPIEVRYTPEEVMDIGGSVQLLDEDDLAAMDYDDPHDVLAQVGGVYVRAEDGYGLRPNIGMRGANSERSRKITLMEDGVLFGPAPYSAPAAYYFPLMLRMTGVEVFKGPSAVLYGPQTIGGAINYVTRAIPDSTAGELTLGAGTDLYGRLHLHHGMRNDWGGFLAELVHLRSDGFKDLDGGGDTGFSRWEAMLKAQANTLSGPLDHTFELKLGFSIERSNETYLGLSDADFARDPNRRYAASQRDRMEWDRLQLQLRHRVEFEPGNLTTTVYRHTMSRAWAKVGAFGSGPSLEQVLADPDAGSRLAFYRLLTGEANSTPGLAEETLIVGTNARDFVSQGVQTVARVGFGEAVESEIDAGLRLHFDEIERHHTADGFLMTDGDLVSDGGETETTTRNRGATLALAAHALYSGTVAGMTFSPGVRVEYIDTRFEDRLEDTEASRDDVVTLPGLGLHYAITDRFGVLGGVHRGFSPVSPGQARSIDPEFSINYEGGARYRDTAGSEVTAIGFFNDYQNLTGECSFSAGCADADLDRQFNGGEARIYGVEVLAGHAFSLPRGLWLPVQATYTFTRTEFLTGFASDNPQFGAVEAGDEMPYVPAHQGHLRVGVEDGFRWAAYAAATAVSEAREEAGSGDDGLTTDAYVRLDLSGRYTFWRELTAQLNVDNVTNTRPIVSRRPYGARSIAPLTVQGALSYAW